MGAEHSWSQRRRHEAVRLPGPGRQRAASCDRGWSQKQVSLNLVFFHSKQKPGACWQWSHIPRVERAEQPWGARLGGSKQGQRRAFSTSQSGLPRELGPMLIFTRHPGDPSWEGRGEQGRAAGCQTSHDPRRLEGGSANKCAALPPRRRTGHRQSSSP